MSLTNIHKSLPLSEGKKMYMCLIATCIHSELLLIRIFIKCQDNYICAGHITAN